MAGASHPSSLNDTASTQPATENQTRRKGRGRGGRRNRGDAQAASANAQQRPQLEAAQQTSSDQSSAMRDGGGGRGRFRGRGRGRLVTTNHARMIPNGRQFGGSLTQEAEPAADSYTSSVLQPDATTFIPNVAALDRSSSVAPERGGRRGPKHIPHTRPQGPKSQAPDIATRTHEDIDNGHYECPICTSEVERKSKVWSCNLCWTVFHLSCIKKWSTNDISGANQTQPQDGSEAFVRHWRCPGCNLSKDELPSRYSCWCGKEIEPRAPSGVPPHSCGQSCLRSRPGQCPHPHTDVCHAGPCPPCTEMGPTKACFCGKRQLTKPCVQTEYEKGWVCGEICGAKMSCGEHICDRYCHDGPCGPCDMRLPGRCYCGKIEKEIRCQDREDARLSTISYSDAQGESVSESWIGNFTCKSPCQRLFDCGIHACKGKCHVQDASPKHCSLAPDTVTVCPCGKTALSELDRAARMSCVDPIPNCDKPCLKPLSCGHLCPAICHSDAECPSCQEMIEISCRCGRTISRSLCHQGSLEQPQCTRVCRTTLNCGRHACDEHCCTGERKALERQSTRKKHRPLGSTLRLVDDLMEPEHICTRMCDRLLSCGTHRDEGLCHKGPCGTCREAIFEELSCHCGRTVIQPPLPCGTPPPPCRFPCNRGKRCGHPQVAHNCHQDDESCPRCPFLVEKRCMCGKKSLKNQQCWLPDVRCGETCGRLLKCGSHRCRKPCHLQAECEDAHAACQQLCGKPKPICGHPDDAKCHSVFACKQETPCQIKIFITCECQAQKQEAKCGVSKTNEGNAAKKLPCTDECARLERNRRLALALNIDQSTHVNGGDHIPYSTDTLNLFAQHTRWAQDQEREFRVFATSDDEKRLRFKPMKPLQRQFIHLLAEDFGLDSEGMDPEPNRHVMIWKTPRFISPPNKTLAEALRIRQLTRGSALSSANVSDNEGLIQKSKASNEVGEPYNAFVIEQPRFGLTVDELRAEVLSTTSKVSAISLAIAFLPNEEVVLKATSPNLSPHEVQHALQSLKTSLHIAISAKGYGSIQLCATDSSLNILRRESDAGTKAGGWSRVAAKKAAPRSLVPGSNSGGLSNNSFAALTGNKITFVRKTLTDRTKQKSVADQDVVDDWETAEIEQENSDWNNLTVGSRLETSEERPGAQSREAMADGEDKAAMVIE